jgi:hypothetical protein
MLCSKILNVFWHRYIASGIIYLMDPFHHLVLKVNNKTF